MSELNLSKISGLCGNIEEVGYGIHRQEDEYLPEMINELRGYTEELIVELSRRAPAPDQPAAGQVCYAHETVCRTCNNDGTKCVGPDKMLPRTPWIGPLDKPQAQAEPVAEQEPAVWVWKNDLANIDRRDYINAFQNPLGGRVPLYTHPAPREAVLEKLAEHIAKAIFDCGDEPWSQVKRIAFIGTCNDDLGGLALEPLTRVIKAALAAAPDHGGEK